VKHQYVGDLNDYRKYALLRALSAGGSVRVGISWMLTASDRRTDGNNLSYLNQPERHRQFDPQLFDFFADASATPDWRRLETIEASAAIPGASYFNTELLDNVSARDDFMGQCALSLADADLIFFDPDNGLEVSLPKGRRGSCKYLYLDEVKRFYASEKSLLIYQHFPRIERGAFTEACATRLRSVAPDAALWAFTTSNVLFLLMIHPNSPARLTTAALEASERWDTRFMTGRYLGVGGDN
jgi:hypothetical protein